MKFPEKILHPVKRIHGGTFLPHLKGTEELETVDMPAPERVYIPMVQHIGAPADVCVNKGDKVYVGTLIGSATAKVCAPVHSSVSGEVEDIITKRIGGRDVQCVVIKSDGRMKADKSLAPHNIKTTKGLVAAAKDSGLVGLGGAGFPTYIKLSPRNDVTIDTLIINAAECEPYITSDYRECMENFNDVVEGIYLIKEKLGIKNAVICVENNKPRAIMKLYSAVIDHRDSDNSVRLMRLPATYPQGAEKVIIYSATGHKLAAGALPSAVGCIVMNITSIGTLYRYISTGMPLTSKRITLEGTGVGSPKNIRVPIGTPIKDVLEFAGDIYENADRIIMGGPMMGSPVTDMDAVIEKRNNAILVMKPAKPRTVTNCIRCGRCAAACPMKLYPQSVESAYNAGMPERFSKLNVGYCMECGSCSYVCPAKRPLTEVMRIAKKTVREMKK